jgi:predicted GIY-YIG superfamily endonuclease
MHWIYILKCEDDHYYVGETTKLYKRFWQHFTGIGGVNTYTYKPAEVVAIYKLNTITKFLDYNKNVLDVINDNYHEYNKWLLINNLHIHSKELDKGLSKPLESINLF